MSPSKKFCGFYCVCNISTALEVDRPARRCHQVLNFKVNIFICLFIFIKVKNILKYFEKEWYENLDLNFMFEVSIKMHLKFGIRR